MRNRISGQIILTGATGFLGAFLMAGLLERGYQVTVLGRGSKGIILSERLSALINWFGIADMEGRLVSVEVDFSKKHLGLDNVAYRSLCADAYKIIHCASDTSFAECNRNEVMATNVDNLSSLLEFAADAKVQHFYYVSSAYACGIREGLCMEEPVTTGRFYNVYEESKAQAEGIITHYCEKNNVPVSILRPSIVYGHSKTGEALKFNALYYMVKSLMTIRDIYLKDISGQGEKRSMQWGVNLDYNGILSLPMSVYLENRGSVNLIPVDFFVQSALGIIEYSGSGSIYHITDDDPPDINRFVGYFQQFLGVRGICTVWGHSEKHPESNPAEELLNKLIKPYRPYMSDMRIFDRNHSKGVTPDLVTPSLTYDVFDRCMAYAVECKWGKKIGFPI